MLPLCFHPAWLLMCALSAVGIDERMWEWCDALQIEARLRQLEGRALEGEAVIVPARGPAKYDSSKPDGGMLSSVPATYNTGADVAMDDAEDGGKEEKKKKVRSCSMVQHQQHLSGRVMCNAAATRVLQSS